MTPSITRVDRMEAKKPANWCKHIRFEPAGDCGGWEGYQDVKGDHMNFMQVESEDWKFCPHCGKPRPA